MYMITVSLVMLNMLIAKMGSTYDRIAQRAELEWLLERARVLCSIENELSPAERQKLHELYCVKDDQGTSCFQVHDHDPDYWLRMQKRKAPAYSVLDQIALLLGLQPTPGKAPSHAVVQTARF